jgi:hypothetical protein
MLPVASSDFWSTRTPRCIKIRKAHAGLHKTGQRKCPKRLQTCKAQIKTVTKNTPGSCKCLIAESKEIKKNQVAPDVTKLV